MTMEGKNAELKLAKLVISKIKSKSQYQSKKLKYLIIGSLRYFEQT